MKIRARVGLLAALVVAAAPILLGVAQPAQAVVGNPVVGAFAGTTADQWVSADAAIGPLKIRRSFDPTIVAAGNEAWRAVGGVSQFYSFKPPGGDVAGMTAGSYDSDVARICADLPGGSRVTVWHEPEDDWSAATMRDLYAHIVPVCHTAAVTAGHSIYFWYVAMAYQWRPGSTTVTDATIATWLQVAAQVDRVGADVYSANWNGFHDLATAPDFQRWLTQLAVPSGKPWGVVERGVSSENGDQARADVLAADWAYLTGLGGTGEPSVPKTYMYWDRDEGCNPTCPPARAWYLPSGSFSAQEMATIAGQGG